MQFDLRTLDRHRDAAVRSLIPALSCRSCRPNAPFAELVKLSRTSIADEMREEHRRRVLGESPASSGCVRGRPLRLFDSRFAQKKFANAGLGISKYPWIVKHLVRKKSEIPDISFIQQRLSDLHIFLRALFLRALYV